MPNSNGITKENLNLILLLDNSYSMSVDGRIDQLNHTIPQLKESLKDVADAEGVNIKLRIISFSDDAVWCVGGAQAGENIENVAWTDLEVDNGTATHLAIREANKALKKEYLGAHALRPVVILVTDGCCNPNDHKAYLDEIEIMKKKLSGTSGREKVTRIAIGVKDYRQEELEEFASEGIVRDIPKKLVFAVDKAADISGVINFVALSSMYSSITDSGNEPPVIDVPADGEDPAFV